MKVVLKLKNGRIEEYKNIWEIQSNSLDNKREACLIGYDHVVWTRIPTNEIIEIKVNFER